MIHIQTLSANGTPSEVISLDATLDVNISSTMVVTDFPVEDGANISDHAQQQPVVVTIRSLVSATPLRIFSLNPIIGDGRTRAAFEILEELQTSKELVRIVTDLKTYDSMALTNFNAPRRQDTKNALLFTATFREVRLVSSQIVTLPPEEQVQEMATSGEDGGKVTAPPTASDKTKEKATILHGLLYGGG